MRKRKQHENKEGTHLAASSSSSFLYSPRWLQKIMVSDNWLTHSDHTHIISIKTQTSRGGTTPSLLLLPPFSASLAQCAPLWLRLQWRCVAGSDHSTFIVRATSGRLTRALPLSVRVSACHPSLLYRDRLPLLGRRSCC